LRNAAICSPVTKTLGQYRFRPQPVVTPASRIASMSAWKVLEFGTSVN
jgi:hypothetical protein